MFSLDPETILLLLLFLYFLAVKRWKVALAAIGFIFITGLVAPRFEIGFEPARPFPVLSIFRIAGCVWFVVVAVAGRLGGATGAGRAGGGRGGTG